ncbi:MAG: hypothetical protein AMXMBFR84_10070 [Candidatus Hydrogenedentota bacterium]
MRRVVSFALILAACSLPIFSQEGGNGALSVEPAASSELAGEKFVLICKISGMIDDGIAVLVERACREAVGAEALIFIIDTPGGRVDSAINISSAMLKAPTRTIAYIEGMGAISAGALISYACDEIIMAPASNMGAAAPVMPSAEGMMPLGEKEVSFVRAKMASLAETKGHNPAIAMAMVDKDIELVAYPEGAGRYRVVATNAGRSADDRDGSAPASEADDAIDVVFENLPVDMEPVKEILKDAARTIQEEATKAKQQEEIEQNPDDPIADAPVIDDLGGRIILGRGKLLTLTPNEAMAYGVIPTTASNIDQILGYFNMVGAEKREIVMTWSEELFRFLTSPIISGLLLMLGIGGLYVEIRTPGFGLAGIVGLVCLGLFFGSRTVIGMSEWIDLLLLAVGLGLIAIEVFVLPGFGFVGISGVVCILAGVYLSLTFSDFTIPQYEWEFERLREAGYTVTVTTVLFAVFVYATWKLFPHTPMYRQLVLLGAQNISEGYTVQGAAETDEYLGKKGIATSPLRPAGRGRFDGKTIQVVTRAEFLEEGTPIIVVQVDGNRYVVDRIKEQTA